MRNSRLVAASVCIFILAACATGSGNGEANRNNLHDVVPKPQQLNLSDADLAKYVGKYLADNGQILTIASQDDYLTFQGANPPHKLVPKTVDEFVQENLGSQIMFNRDANGNIVGLSVHAGVVTISAVRVTEADLQIRAAALAQRIKANAPAPGSEAAVRRIVDELRRGQPNYSKMSGGLTTLTRQQLPLMRSTIINRGQLQGVVFKGIDSRDPVPGRDIYQAQFEHGSVIFLVATADDGKITNLEFHLEGEAAQQNDPGADTSVLHPTFTNNSGPIIAVDSAHNNYHTIENRYEPFAALLRNDSFRVVDSKSLFTTESLAPFKVLVISNALPLAVPQSFTLSEASAFSPTEIEAVKNWVSSGGSLLLIADHFPAAGSARDLALAFGFRFEDGVVERDPLDGRPDIFAIPEGTLRDDAVTRGRSANEKVTTLRTFTGSVFQAPAAAHPIIVFPAGFKIHQCGLPCPGNVPEYDGTGYLQGAVMVFGKGRIAVFGEAAVFSAQINPSFPSPDRFGFNAPGAEQNKQFILNLLHWLTDILPE